MADPYNLERYKLTLPINHEKKLTGHAAELLDLKVNWPHAFPWFSKVGDALQFMCPDGGAVTDTAKYARTELRDMRQFSYAERASDSLRFSVAELAENHKVVVHQIHDGAEPWTKLVYTRRPAGENSDMLRLLVKHSDGADDTGLLIRDDIIPGEVIDFRIDYFPQKQYIRVKTGEITQRVRMQRTGKNGMAYFKRGCYYQNMERKGKVCTILHV